MALRTIRTKEDEILRKKSKEVKKITPRTLELIDDMLETMYDAEGVGLAAVQVGVLRRVVVIDIGDGPVILINPEIIDKSEKEYLEVEGCLSVPGEQGFVFRPEEVTVKALDREGEEQIIESKERFFSKAICHELEHLDGILYTDHLVEPSEEQMKEIIRQRKIEQEDEE
ncbi:peptide deformylase [Anaerofustis sp. NSJ-163]|uniref:peptide deformylase n=1 Tax=Anaerofustis sp. NSJ-163 TaxID=2944391 RepID=UPI00209C6D47|nr:peptide deformylase [Anaerofustis sp. NSJ-163]MCO8193275.1 peptide deformylase [Anaerofustis sp. NSJ-163]